MKIFYTTLLVVLLASCSEATPQESTQTAEDQTIPAIETTIDDIDTAIESIELSEEETIPETEEQDTPTTTIQTEETQEVSVETEEPQEEEVVEETVPSEKLIELSTKYNNPKIEVLMDIDMTVDNNDIIQSISVTSPNYQGMPEFNSGIQAVVGMSVDEASEYYVSGSSLTTPAFQAALKNR